MSSLLATFDGLEESDILTLCKNCHAPGGLGANQQANAGAAMSLILEKRLKIGHYFHKHCARTQRICNAASATMENIQQVYTMEEIIKNHERSVFTQQWEQPLTLHLGWHHLRWLQS